MAITRFGEPILLIVGLGLASGILFIIPSTNLYIILLVSIMFLGFSHGTYVTCSTSFLMRISPESERGTTSGLMSIFRGVLNTFLSFLIGIIADVFGIQSTYVISALIMCIIFSIILIFGYKKRIY
jgi:MFS family permease